MDFRNVITIDIKPEKLVQDLRTSLTWEELVELVILLEKKCVSMDFTEPLYQYFKKVMKKESPESL